jgi:DNA-binding CsgD family transcriptional regulator
VTAPLTEREVAVLLAAALGRSQRETAAQLHIGRGPVRRSLDRAVEKLGAVNVTHAVSIAIGRNLFEPATSPSGTA